MSTVVREVLLGIRTVAEMIEAFADEEECRRPAFLCTLMALSVDDILFSVDWPYESNRSATDWLSPSADHRSRQGEDLSAER